jgi:phosphoribosylformylglycinamidine cyclo-ligase
MKHVGVRGMAHMTGGGLTDNIPRILPKTLDAEIDLKSWRPLPIFELIRREGNIARDEMLRTFNMGVGMVMVVSPADEAKALEGLADEGEEPWRIGRIIRGTGVVRYVE